jgi:ferredoxin--NADP+ reductase
MRTSARTSEEAMGSLSDGELNALGAAGQPFAGSAAAASTRCTAESILTVRSWAPHLFSLRTSRHRGFRFTPGQFARLGLAREDGSVVWRAYSIASAAYDEHLEFFSVVVPGGEFTGRLAALRCGDRLLVDKTSYGYLTADRLAGGADLWMLSSGTGLAPFLSILRDPAVWAGYENLILVHSVRRTGELAYREEIAALPPAELVDGARARLRYLPVVTRERVADALPARIPQLIEDGRLEAAAGVPLDLERSRIMVCGNPEMTDDLRRLLAGRGFRVSRRASPGHMAFENYW